VVRGNPEGSKGRQLAPPDRLTRNLLLMLTEIVLQIGHKNFFLLCRCAMSEKSRRRSADGGGPAKAKTWQSSGHAQSAKITMEREPIGTVLAGPSTLLREGLARVLSAAKFRILACTSCVDDRLLSELPQAQPILLLIDVSDGFDAALGQIESFKQRYPAGRVAVLAPQYKLAEMVSAFRGGANAYFVKVATCDTFIKSLELVMLGQTILPPAILPVIFDRMDVGRNGPAAGEEKDPADGHATDGEASDHDNRHEDDDGDDDDDSDDGEMFGSGVGTYAKVPDAEKGFMAWLTARQKSILRCLVEGDCNKAIARKMDIAESTVKVHVKAILRKTRFHNRTQVAMWAMVNGLSIAVKKDDLPALRTPRVRPSPSLCITQALPLVQNNGSVV
jgi:two-component system nitrate/nitrite response regulator NarL